MRLHDLANSRRFVHAALHDVDPLAARRREHEVLPQLAGERIGHVHDGAVAHVHRRLDDAGLRGRHLVGAHGIREVLVDLALENGLVVEEEAVRPIE